MKSYRSFSQKMRQDGQKSGLMAHYALSEMGYERIMECLKGIR